MPKASPEKGAFASSVDSKSTEDPARYRPLRAAFLPTSCTSALMWLMKKCFPKDDFAAVVRAESAKRRQQMADDELPQK